MRQVEEACIRALDNVQAKKCVVWTCCCEARKGGRGEEIQQRSGGGGRVRETGHMGRKGGEKRKGTLGMARRARYMVMMAKVVSNYCALS